MTAHSQKMEYQKEMQKNFIVNMHNVIKNGYRIWTTRNCFNSATQKSKGLLGEQELIM